MASRESESRRTAANVVVQSGLGGVFYGIWVFIGAYMYEDALAQSVIGGLPYFICYELGILSRYVPGVKAVARRLR